MGLRQPDKLEIYQNRLSALALLAALATLHTESR